MSFFDNPKNFGLAAIVIGAISMILGLAGIVTGALASPIATGSIVASIGTIAFGVLIFGVGLPAYKGEVSDKLTILGMFVKVIGLAVIISGIFSGAGEAIADGIAAGAISIVISVILGLILMWIAGRITDGSVDMLDRILWIILLVVFAILTLLYLVGIITPFLTDFSLIEMVIAAVQSLCYFVLFAFLLVSILSEDVKSAMGM